MAEAKVTVTRVLLYRKGKPAPGFYRNESLSEYSCVVDILVENATVPKIRVFAFIKGSFELTVWTHEMTNVSPGTYAIVKGFRSVTEDYSWGRVDQMLDGLGIGSGPVPLCAKAVY